MQGAASSAETGVFERMRRAQEVRAAVARIAQRNRATVGQTFRAFDADHDGVVTAAEMLRGLQALRVPEAVSFRLDAIAVADVVESFDLDHDGRLTEQDWRDYFRQLRQEQEAAAGHEVAAGVLAGDWMLHNTALSEAAEPQPTLQPADSVHPDARLQPLLRTASEDDRVDDMRRQTSTAEWHDSIREYETGEEIGEGAFGKVHLWTLIATGQRFACKKINKLQMEEADMVILDREINLLRELDHPNIVKLHRALRATAHRSPPTAASRCPLCLPPCRQTVTVCMY